jgi:signal transduction histidine kinase/ActR/RegA family two-component response regulator
MIAPLFQEGAAVSRSVPANAKFGLYLSIGDKIALSGAIMLAPFVFMLWQLFVAREPAITATSRQLDDVQFLQVIDVAAQRVAEYRNQYVPSDGEELKDAIEYVRRRSESSHRGETQQVEIVRDLVVSASAIDFYNRAEQSTGTSQLLIDLGIHARQHSGLQFDELVGEQGYTDLIQRRTPSLRTELLAVERRLESPFAPFAGRRREVLTAISTLEAAVASMEDIAPPNSLSESYVGVQHALRALIEELRAPSAQGQLAGAQLGAKWRAVYDSIVRLEAGALTDVEESLRHRLDQLRANRLYALAAAVLVLLVSLLFAGQALRAYVLHPVRQLTDSAASLLDGDYGGDIPLQARTDEVGAIARFLATFREVAESRTQAEALRQSAEQANIAKSQFIANMSHELRTPLNAIIGYVEMLVESAADRLEEEDIEDLTRVLSAARHLLGLINDILDVSKVEAGRMDLFVEDLDPVALLADVAATVRPMAAKNNTRIVLEPSEGEATFRTDELKLKQCLFNLMSNACKFTRDGEVRVGVRRWTDRGRSKLSFRVADTGVGISNAQMGRLFQPFVQADESITREFGGTGLGLVITRKLARLLGGDVAVESALGVGSTFTLTVTASEAPAEPDDVIEASASERPVVILIDDERRTHDLVASALTPLGFVVRGAAGADAGLSLVRQMQSNGAQVALILLDLHLPDRPGWSVLSAIKADPMLSDIPVVIFSVDGDRETSIALGAAEHVLKTADGSVVAATALRFARQCAPSAATNMDDLKELKKCRTPEAA